MTNRYFKRNTHKDGSKYQNTDDKVMKHLLPLLRVCL